ncbi:MAG: hypothetical protein ACI9Y7_000541 [Dokdonia sp.]|jgi:hypothetical protein
MAKKWTSFLKPDTTPTEKKEVSQDIDLSSILEDNEDIQQLLQEKEALEEALKNTPGTKKEGEGDPRFRESEIIPITTKKKLEKKWSQNREELLKKKKEEGKQKDLWEKNRNLKKAKLSEKPKRKKPLKIRPKKKKEEKPLRTKKEASLPPKRRVHKKTNQKEIENWLKQRLKKGIEESTKKKEAQAWLQKQEKVLDSSKKQLIQKKKEVQNWVEKQGEIKEKSLENLKNKQLENSITEKLKKPADTVYAYLDQKKKKKPTLKELGVGFQKVYKKKQQVLKKPNLEKSWEELLDKRREVVSQSKKSKKEMDQKMKIVTTVAKDIWEKRDLLKKERIQEAIAEKKELLRAEAKKQAKAQERKQNKKNDRFF